MPQPMQRWAELDGGMRRAFRLLAVLALGTMLAACGRCGDFWPSSTGQGGACHSDAPPQ